MEGGRWPALPHSGSALMCAFSSSSKDSQALEPTGGKPPQVLVIPAAFLLRLQRQSGTPGLTSEENSRLACPAHSDCLILG